MMLGYSIDQKAYKLWDLNKGEVTVSRDVYSINPKQHTLLKTAEAKSK